MNKKDKVKHVLSQGQTRDHICHWPGCRKQVPPALWGCLVHWKMIPQYLKNKIWDTYRIGQEKDMRPSKEYIAAAREVDVWIKEHLKKKDKK